MITPILDVYYSIQGEGLYMGLPAVFVRFPNCNLRCSWCDSKESWDSEPQYSLLDVKNLIESKHAQTVVFSGGEPLLKEYIISSIINWAPDLNYVIETNGTLIPGPTLSENENIFWSISPKLFLREWNRLLPDLDTLTHAQFIFVITDPVRELRKISHLQLSHPIIVQADCTVSDYPEACRLLAEKVLAYKYNIRVLPQFDKICWGLRKKV